ncbi:MAG TPA: HypC/HybG/HupF family hydrogenase formation chaperone [Dissulfurispiraceae bacterium]|nr:HypC/HybG/HupF family hydrogenase formation chaperone [Dissulfurispiraceae bacterium]
MCLAIPSRIIEIEDLVATVDISGARKKVSLLLLPEEPKIGDYVLVHAGFAIHSLDEEAAQETLKLLRQMADAYEDDGSLK